MPLYEFACKRCQHSFEELVIGDELVHCPKCESSKLERLLSLPARPHAVPASAGLPISCRSDGPPCGPQCGRFK